MFSNYSINTVPEQTVCVIFRLCKLYHFWEKALSFTHHKWELSSLRIEVSNCARRNVAICKSLFHTIGILFIDIGTNYILSQALNLVLDFVISKTTLQPN
jgi:hypothetical protein